MTGDRSSPDFPARASWRCGGCPQETMSSSQRTHSLSSLTWNVAGLVHWSPACQTVAPWERLSPSALEIFAPLFLELSFPTAVDGHDDGKHS